MVHPSEWKKKRERYENIPPDVQETFDNLPPILDYFQVHNSISDALRRSNIPIGINPDGLNLDHTLAECMILLEFCGDLIRSI